jgi:hypothetical protein
VEDVVNATEKVVRAPAAVVGPVLVATTFDTLVAL